MSIKKIMRGSLLCLISLGVISGLTSNYVNAKSRPYHHRRTRSIHRRKGRHDRRHSKRARLVRKHRRIIYHVTRRPAKKRHAKQPIRHGKYRWMNVDYNNSQVHLKVQIVGHDKSNGEPYVRLVNKHQIKLLGGFRYVYTPSEGLFPSKAAAVKAERESTRPSKKRAKSNVKTSTWRNNVAKDEMNLITQDRAEHGKAPLQESPELDQIAQMRAKQTYQNNLMATSDPHVDQSTGQSYDDEDAQQLGDNDLVGTMGENLAGGIEDPSAKATAKYDNDMLYTNEEASDGGHYQNIIGEYYSNPSEVDENYQTVGVGDYGNVLAEDFSLNS